MSCYSEILKKSPEFKTIMNDVESARYPVGVTGLSLVHKAHFISSLCTIYKKHALVITPDEATANRMISDFTAFGTDAFLFPARDLSFRGTDAVSHEYEHTRLKALDRMLSGDYDAVVLSAEALSQLTVPPELLDERCFTVREGETIDLDSLIDLLLKAGYTHCDEVDGPGLFARRGGILDFFPPDSSLPYRIEFWGDTVDSVCTFELSTQRRTENVKKIRITPAREVLCDRLKLISLLRAFVKQHPRGKAAELIKKDITDLEDEMSLPSLDKYMPVIYPEAASILDYADDCFITVVESFSVRTAFNSACEVMNETVKNLFEDGILCRGLDRFTISSGDLLRAYVNGKTFYIDNFPRGSFDTPVKDLVSFTAKQINPWSGSFASLLDDISALRAAKGRSVVILAGMQKAAEALCGDLQKSSVSAEFCPSPPRAFRENTVYVLPGSFSAGFEYPSANFTLITYLARNPVKKELHTAAKKKSTKNAFNNLDELHRGDYVVHAAHGIGIFDGINKMDAGGTIKDYIKILYDKGDVLYVPVTQLDQVSKYIGGGSSSEEKTVKLNRLGGRDWQKTRSKVKKAVADMAKQLIELYSKRLKMPGYAFSPDIDMQSDFERRFEFEETDDQLRCIYEIKKDMEKPYPMDRLLCGDVGFGKTEVALRAAFKCIADGKQCAFLVPTTILALQHYQTITRRFDGFPIEAGMLSRFCSRKDIASVISGLRNGTVDIVVGTHRLISKDVEFRDLGLIIVDEEQRFGVAQKEKLKEKFPTVDVLTLTATPIPRTLNMAMTGIRDMSVLEEAPQDRSPVQTYVLEHNMPVLIHAMESELRRGGQVYYLHNRVESIEKAAFAIKEAIPSATVGIAHGKMSEDELSEIWRKLLEGEIDILVCTTIIETGVDVPNVNTLIIENADRMGLAQLHQIRGRVGRSSRRASAYFTFRRGSQPSEIATRRLDAIREFTEFGSGFKIAMRDLELRGAGNILGASQHGHMESVGYEMYIKLLEQAINEEKGEAPAIADKDCLIDLPIDAYIPSDYISSVPQRLKIYRRIADIHSEEDAIDVTDELIDRFGEPPECVQGLIKIALLRGKAAKNDIYEIKKSSDRIVLFISDIDMAVVSSLAAHMKGRITISTANGKPHISVKMLKDENQLAMLERIFRFMDEAKKDS